jgi:hypothetical protein
MGDHSMDTQFKLMRPDTFVTGETYYLSNKNETSQVSDLVSIKFIAYNACPAFVIIDTGSKRIRCSRDDVFIPITPLADRRRSAPRIGAII